MTVALGNAAQAKKKTQGSGGHSFKGMKQFHFHVSKADNEISHSSQHFVASRHNYLGKCQVQSSQRIRFLFTSSY